MKKIFLIAGMFFAAVAITPAAQAQVSVKVNIGSQPGWGPTGYDYASFYYFPDYNFYFDVSRGQYIIYNNRKWSYTRSVPASYRFDPYNAYKVVVNQNKPYQYNTTHKKTYAKYKGQGSKQSVIRNSREYKYYESKDHPNHNQWSKQSKSSNKNTNKITQKQETKQTGNNRGR